MEISKFKLQDTLLDLKDETARQLIDDAQTVADRAEGKADDAQTVADRAEGKADDAQAVADRAEGKANDALRDIDSKQNVLSHGSYSGDVDSLYGNADTDLNGYYFVNASTASGTHPVTGYYMLIVFGGLQIAANVTSGSTAYLYVRTYVNNAWSAWRKAQLTT